MAMTRADIEESWERYPSTLCKEADVCAELFSLTHFKSILAIFAQGKLTCSMLFGATIENLSGP